MNTIPKDHNTASFTMKTVDIDIPRSSSETHPAMPDLTCEPFPLLTLPPEVVLIVASTLPVSALNALTRTCNYLYDLLNPTLYTAGATLRFPDLSTPLHWAAHHHSSKVASRLISRGASLLALDSNGAPPFHHACTYPSLPFQLLFYHPTLPSLRPKYNCPDCLNIKPNFDKDGQTALYIAVSIGHMPTVKFLLKHHPELVSIPTTDEKETPLHRSAPHPEIAQILLDHGANLNARNFDGTTPLSAALTHTQRTDLATCTILLDAGADPNIDQSPLETLITWGFVEKVRLLLEKGLDVTRRRRYGSLLLHSAVKMKQEELVTMLIDAAPETIHQVTAVGSVLLGFAARFNPESIPFLVQRGANPKQLGTDGKSALWGANNCATVKMLLGLGVPVAVRDDFGRCIFHRRVDEELLVRLREEVGENEVVKWVGMRDFKGRTPLMKAIHKESLEMIGRLLNWGAEVKSEHIVHACRNEKGMEMVDLMLREGKVRRRELIEALGKMKEGWKKVEERLRKELGMVECFYK